MFSTLPRTIISLFFAVMFSQAPEFFQQYTQNVDGEIRGLYSSQRFVTGERERELLLLKHEKTMTHFGEMRDASALTRPIVFFSGMNREAAQATWNIYRPAVPTTTEGAMYAISGFFFGSFLFSLLFWMLGRRSPDAV